MSTEIEEYFKKFPKEIQDIFSKIRGIILGVVPDASERISYGMPGYFLDKKPLVYFAGFKNHIGFYATPNGHEAFKKDFAKYKQGKGSVQFPLNQPIPYDLIKKVVEFRKDFVEKNK